MRPAGFFAAGLAALLLCAAVAAPGGLRWRLPADISATAGPGRKSADAAKVALGRRLFYDADLSLDGTMACATCHEQHRAFAEGNPTHGGVTGEAGRRNVPGLANVAWARHLTGGDRRITTLEAQALVPMFGTHPVEMGMTGQEAELARRLGKDSCYAAMFDQAFPETGGRIDKANIAGALAAFERTLVSFDSPYDAWRRGDRAALSPVARSGQTLFARHCAECHAGVLLSDGDYHAVIAPTPSDQGLSETSGLASDRGRFRTPSLRNAALTAPYFHDGSTGTLEEAIRRHPSAAGLDMDEVAKLAEFLRATTDRHFVTDPSLSLPDTACGRKL